MLTQAMPALTKALAGVIPPVALRQLTQALGNCNQNVTQRGDVQVQPNAWMNANNRNGTYSGNTWNAQDFPDLLNNIDGRQFFDIAGDQYPSSNSYYGDQLYNVSVSNSYPQTFFGDNISIGGDTFNTTNANNYYNTTQNINYAGDTIDNRVTYGDVVTTVGGITQNFYNGPAGPPGSPGAAGGNGRDGRDGGMGLTGPAGPAGPAGQQGAAGQNGRDGRDGRDGVDGGGGGGGVLLPPSEPLTYVREVIVRKRLYNLQIPTAVNFDPETCTVSLQYDPVNIEYVEDVFPLFGRVNVYAARP